MSQALVNGGAVAITASNVTEYNPPLKAINVAVSGTVALVFHDGTSAAPYLAAGILHPFGGVKQVLATGTAATGIMAFKSVEGFF